MVTFGIRAKFPLSREFSLQRTMTNVDSTTKEEKFEHFPVNEINTWKNEGGNKSTDNSGKT